MAYYDGRPVLNNLPQKGYQDNDVVDWLTLWTDQKLSDTADIMESFWENLIPETCPESYLDYLAFLCGLSGPYWDPKWTIAVKRLMIANAHKFWSNKGTLQTIKDILDIHSLTYSIWTNGALRVPFAIPAVFGRDDLRMYIRLPLVYQRISPQFKEAQRTARNYAPAVVGTKVCFERFYTGFSYVGDPVFLDTTKASPIQPTVLNDPYKNYNTLYLKGDSGDQSTYFVDDSIQARAVYPGNSNSSNPTTVQSSTQVKYGASSIYINRTNTTSLFIPMNLTMAGDYTLEGWFYVLDTSNHTIFAGASNGDSDFAIRSNNISVGRSNVAWDIEQAAGTNLVNSTWTHIAYSRTSGVQKIFVNGVQIYSGTYTQAITISSFARIGVTYDLVQAAWVRQGNYYLDSFRITNGVGRYSAAFNPNTQTVTYLP